MRRYGQGFRDVLGNILLMWSKEFIGRRGCWLGSRIGEKLFGLESTHHCGSIEEPGGGGTRGGPKS